MRGSLPINRRLTGDQLEEVRARLSKRAPDAVMTAAEAAIYTGRSIRTLKRAIDAGVGPRREKNPDVSGRGATNRHTRYRKSDLDAWREGLIAFAVDFRDFDDLAMEAPWVADGDRLARHLLDLDGIDAVLEALAAEVVTFLRLDEALTWSWVSGYCRQPYQQAFETICGVAVRAAADAAQRDALEAETGQASAKGRKPIRP